MSNPSTCSPLRPSRPRPSLRPSLLGVLGLFACSPPAASPSVSLRSATPSEVATVTLGRGTTCAATLTGQAKCWGHRDGGRLGNGTAAAGFETDPSDLPPLELGDEVDAIVTNGDQSFALLADGRVRAFGLNDAGQLGLGHTETIGDDETPTMADVATIVPLAGGATQLAAGEGFACARLLDGRVQCWGRGDDGQLGRGALTGIQPPGDVVLGGSAMELAAGAAHACARLETGAVRCWGRGDHGQLGYGTTATSSGLPAAAGDVPLGGAAVQITAGAAHTCALLDTGAIRCWGDNAGGQLGLGHTQSVGDDETPAQAGDVPVGGLVDSVAAGLRHTCAVLTDGQLRCWGDDTLGPLGLSPQQTIGDDELPLDAPPVDFQGLAVEAVFAGPLASHTCARLDGGDLRCWGLGDRGQLGLGFVNPQDPVEGPPGDLPDVIIVEDPDL